MKKLFDLRFVIGIFFLVIGVLILLYGFFDAAADPMSVNKWCGVIFTLFGILMLILSLRKPIE
jgi:hypothetical protein